MKNKTTDAIPPFSKTKASFV